MIVHFSMITLHTLALSYSAML